MLLVIDSGGIGAAPDAGAFGDRGANTLRHVMAARDLSLPNLTRMGLGVILGLKAAPRPEGWAARVHPESAGKDSMAGHWAMMGMVIDRPFRTYPEGFPAGLRERLVQALGTPVLGMEIASGTEIVERLGPEHLGTGYPIVYTSADSVLQIAAHEERIAVDRLYELCEAARRVMQGEDLVGRIIARPFVTRGGRFVRTDERRDFTVAPPGESVLTRLANGHVNTVGIGKIGDIFSGQGLRRSEHARDNQDALERTARLLESENEDEHEGRRSPDGRSPENLFVFTNLGDFDTKWGHRRDVDGYAAGLIALDAFLPRLTGCLGPLDQLWISADHGCDPTYQGTDHTREDVPWLVAGPGLVDCQPPKEVRMGMADIGATLCALFDVDRGGLPGQVVTPLIAGAP